LPCSPILATISLLRERHLIINISNKAVQPEEIETPDGGSGDTDVSAQIERETGEALATTKEGSEGPGEVIDTLESARCVIHGVVAECMYGSDDDETLDHDKYVSPRSL
jgi:hypothetical protein